MEPVPASPEWRAGGLGRNVMASRSQPPRPSKWSEAYDRILRRATDALAEAETSTWETLKEEIDQAVAFEEDVAELTREELALLRAYIQREIADLRNEGKTLAEWLALDLSLVEGRLRDLLLSVADKTWVEQVELEQRLKHQPGQYLAGEIAAAGMLQCLNCDAMVCLVETSRIEPCHRCGNHYFRRITARWPREPEVDQPSA